MLKGHSRLESAISYGGRFIDFIVDLLQPLIKEHIDTSIIDNRSRDLLINSHSINVYLDDLDRGWLADIKDIRWLSALLNAIRDLLKESKNIRFRVALRSDVYFLIRTSDESTDKLEGSVVWHKWTNHEILAMMVKRIQTYFGSNPTDAELLRMPQYDLAEELLPVMERTFHGVGKWADIPIRRVLMSLVRKRPRDLVKLCYLGARCAFEAGHSRIATADWKTIFADYSQGRLQDTINEFKTELPDIEKLLIGMRITAAERKERKGNYFATNEMIGRIKKVTGAIQFRFRNGQIASPIELAAFLYKINFITARKELRDGLIDRKYFEEQRYLISQFADFGYDWEIHPAYRWALQPEAGNQIYFDVGLSADDDEVSW